MLLSPTGLHIYYSPTKLTLPVYPRTPSPFLISPSCQRPRSGVTPLSSLVFIPRRWVVSPFGAVVASSVCFFLELSVWIIVICVHDSLPLKRQVLHRLFNHVLFYSVTQHHHWNFFFFGRAIGFKSLLLVQDKIKSWHQLLVSCVTEYPGLAYFFIQ